ncbi:MAG TPA: hypothetical protein VFW33_03875 [Gemmataceae bacterium]|nr:hypothetical protein [Gemmataceae bacterium]
MTTATLEAPATAPAEAPPPAAPPAPAAQAEGPDWLLWRVVRERGEVGSHHPITLRMEWHGHNPDRAAVEEALAWGPHAEALRRRFAVGPAEEERRRLARALDGARQELAAIERKVRRAELDKADAMATLAGERLTKALGKADAAVEEANARLAESKRGLGVLERDLAAATRLSRREADDALARLDGEAAQDVCGRLAERRKEVESAIVTAAGPLLDELLGLMLAQEALVQNAPTRREKAGAVLARLNAEAPAAAEATA